MHTETVDTQTGEITGLPTDVAKFLAELDGGVFEEKLSHALSDVSGAVSNLREPGSVSIKFDIKPLGSGAQVTVAHKLTYARPTLRGKAGEEDTTETPMYVGRRGKLSLFPENQIDMFNRKKD
jgi:hypothetical protein